MILANRLTERLRATGVGQSELARRVGMKPQGIQSIVAGGVERPRLLREIANALNTTEAYLLGETDDDTLEAPRREVRLVGYVGAGAIAHYYADGDDPGETVDAPEGATEYTVAVEIRGESLGALFEHWLVFYDEVRSPVTTDMIGRLCVVGLEDGRVLVKQIQRSRTDGLHHLISNTEAPILDVVVAWAARVRAMVPR